MATEFGVTSEIRNPAPWSPNRTVRVKDTGFTSLHEARSFAGYEIQKPFVKSVCAYARDGKEAGAVGLWLDKDKENHVTVREYNPTLS